MEIKHTFNQKDLDTLTARAIDRYKNSVVGHGTLNGAIIQISGDNPADFTRQVMQLALGGYTLHDTLSPSLGGAAGHYIGFFVKPDNIQLDDIAQLKVTTESDYRAELRRQYEIHLEAMVAESVARAERAEAKKAEEKRAKLVEQARKDAISALGEFVDA